jgi:hypothetical protein
MVYGLQPRLPMQITLTPREFVTWHQRERNPESILCVSRELPRNGTCIIHRLFPPSH